MDQKKELLIKSTPKHTRHIRKGVCRWTLGLFSCGNTHQKYALISVQ